MNDSTRKKGKKESKLKGYDNVFATRLRKLVEQADITQGTLAKESGCSRQAISQYMDGSSMPNVDKLLSIANFFGVSTDYLLGREEKKNEKELQHIISDYLGLSESAIQSFKEDRDNAKKSKTDYDETCEVINSMFIKSIITDIASQTVCYVDAVEKGNKRLEDIVRLFSDDLPENEHSKLKDVLMKDAKSEENYLTKLAKEEGYRLFMAQNLITNFVEHYSEEIARRKKGKGGKHGNNQETQ